MSIAIRYLLCIGIIILILAPQAASALVRGIYVTQPTLESTKRLKYLIREAKKVDIDTFVVDAQYRSKRYARNIKLVHAAGIRYVARIVVFPGGGGHHHVSDKSLWKKRMKLVNYAISLGAKDVQLDYIRYHIKVRSSSQNAQNINRVIRWFRNQIGERAQLQVAVFGETSFGESRVIGQNVRLFAENIDVLNPMVYPSHYNPWRYHTNNPYKTVFKSMIALRKQFNYAVPFKLYPYVEMTNYHRRMPSNQLIPYIRAQIMAVREGGADGWYAWSPRNKYNNLFRALKGF